MTPITITANKPSTKLITNCNKNKEMKIPIYQVIFERVLSRRRNVHVIPVKKYDSEEYEYQMDPDYPFQKGDIVIVLRQTNIMVELNP